MITDKHVTYALNINLHVLILFTFLTVFFFTYITRLEEKTISDELNTYIYEQTDSVLTKLNDTTIKVDWDNIYKLGTSIYENASGTLGVVNKTNKNLIIVATIVISVLVLLFISLGVYSYYKGMRIHWKSLFLENLIVFTFVGMVELLFFMFIASKYSPVTPDTMAQTILSRLHNNIDNTFNN